MLTVVCAILVGLVAETASGARGPTERGCLLAWNARENAASRERVVSEGPWAAALLLPGVASMLRWQRGSAPTQATAQACLLTLVKPRELQPVTGIWRNERVPRWSFGRVIGTDTAPVHANVRILGDGRVTKIHRR